MVRVLLPVVLIIAQGKARLLLHAQPRSWGCHMVHHALYQKQNYSYAGVIEALSGAPYDVRFISFDDVKADPSRRSRPE